MTNHKNGTYAAVTFHSDTNRAIHKFLSDTNLPNAVRPDQLHTTLLYCRTPLPEYEPMGFMMMANYGKPTDLDIWFGESGERCLVLKYDCPELCIRHKYLMETHNATYDFPDFTPHITLSYDMCDVDIASLPNIHDYLDSICITYEYSRELIVDWNSTVLINKS